MKIAVMQPYLFPYIGYWQLVDCVDKFVFFDDVNFIKRGYIHRNTIMVADKEHRFTLPIKKASQNKLINELEITGEHNILKTIELAYKKSLFFEEVFPLVKNVLNSNSTNLSRFVENSIIEISKFLNITTEFLRSSSIPKPEGLKGEDKIITICKKLGASVYVNTIGGQNLYDGNRFKQENIELKFIKNTSKAPNTSVLDLFLRLGPEYVKNNLNQFHFEA